MRQPERAHIAKGPKEPGETTLYGNLSISKMEKGVAARTQLHSGGGGLVGVWWGVLFIGKRVSEEAHTRRTVIILSHEKKKRWLGGLTG